MKYLATYESFNTSTKLPTIEEVNKSLKDLKEIGEGGNAIVYNINDNFVVRVIKRTSKVEMTEKINNINPVSVFPGYNFGQIVANTDIKSITILKKQNGTPIEDKTTSVEQYIENIKKASNLPQETFDNFVKDVVYLEENNYMIDPSKSNNFLIELKKSMPEYIVSVSNINWFKLRNNYPKASSFVSENYSFFNKYDSWEVIRKNKYW